MTDRKAIARPHRENEAMTIPKELPYICPDHPQAQIRHEWNRTHYVMNGELAGAGLDSGHQYFCNDCGRELAAEPPAHIRAEEKKA